MNKMLHMDDLQQNNAAIEDLREEKNRLLAEISELQEEVAAIDRVIRKYMARTHGEITGEKVNKKNVDRIVNEQLILKILSHTTRKLRTSDIYRQMQVSHSKMNYNTLRSYVARMRDKGLIRKTRNNTWELVQKEDGSELF